MARRNPPVIADQLLAGAAAKTAFEKDGLLDELKKALVERALNAEMDHHLEKGTGGPTAATATASARQGTRSVKTVLPARSGSKCLGISVQLRPAADRQVSAAVSGF